MNWIDSLFFSLSFPFCEQVEHGNLIENLLFFYIRYILFLTHVLLTLSLVLFVMYKIKFILHEFNFFIYKAL